MIEQVEGHVDPDSILAARLERDELRLAADEARLAADEEEARSTRVLSLTGATVAGVLVIAVAALVIAIVALRRDVHAIASAAPAGSVGTASIQDSAVTAPKLSLDSVGAGALQPHAVTRTALAPAAVGAGQLAPGAVKAAQVAPDALTGADIREGTLARVPSAARAQRAGTAGNAGALGGAKPGAYVAHLRTVRESTVLSREAVKGPLTARCPAGARIVSGGAAVEGAVWGTAIVASAPQGHGWTALARRSAGRSNPWRLVVSAICATGGA